MHKQQIFDQEKVHFNLVRYTKHGKNFEIVVDPDLAIAFKDSRSKSNDELATLVKAEKVFYDAKKGGLAAEQDLIQVFGTDEFFPVAQKMIAEGEIQLTAEYRDMLRENKRKQIISLIHRAAVDPKTNLPHPLQRIENAMNEVKVKIDEFRKAEDQVKEVMSKLKPILPLKTEERTLSIEMKMQYASKLRGVLQGYGKVKNEIWQGEHYFCEIEVPAGLQAELIDELNSKTHGSINVQVRK